MTAAARLWLANLFSAAMNGDAMSTLIVIADLRAGRRRMVVAGEEEEEDVEPGTFLNKTDLIYL